MRTVGHNDAGDAPLSLKYATGAVYILIVAVGSYVGLNAWLGTEGVHYFASRSNVLNQLFVKRGWFWFSVVFWSVYFSRSSRSPFRPTVLRYAIATAWWVLFTQWFFGAPIMDRVFVLTGGSCQIDVSPDSLTGKAIEKLSKLPLTSAACRIGGGSWAGGHDPSGHVFLLVHSSLVLWMEVLPDLLHRRRTGASVSWGVKLTIALLGLWAFMLFMTSIYFHSVAEKVSGLISGYVVAFIVYVHGKTARWGRLLGMSGTAGTPQTSPQRAAAYESNETKDNERRNVTRST